jgi:hypothetical protein
LPQELRLRGLQTREEANRFLKRRYIREFNRKFTVAATQPGTAFVPAGGMDLDRIFSIQQERVVNQDNTSAGKITACRLRKRPGGPVWQAVE